MKINLRKELPLITIVFLPLLYLAYIWTDLPNEVPIHWNIKGEIDDYANKELLILLSFIVSASGYLTFLLSPILDPKKRLDKMGAKFQNLKSSCTIISSSLAIFIIYSTKNGTSVNNNIVFLIVSVLVLVLGNYLKTLKPNYFIGIRTPWTLESEIVWKETHRLASKLWFYGGLVMICSSLILSKEPAYYFFISTILSITVIPAIYSYFRYRKSQQIA